MIVVRLLTRLLGAPEEINGAGRCPTYLFRWTLLSTRWGKAYVHRFVGDDWSRDLHDHPKRFVSVGVWGAYEEETPGNVWSSRSRRTVHRAPWIRSFPATHRHRLRLLSRECWTLVIVGPPAREWGFYPNGRFVRWDRYVKSPAADSAKAC